MHNGSKHTVNVKKEVIVSCGVIQSPQLLELSGIGDPEVLKAAGIACKVENLGVGNNFQDPLPVNRGVPASPRDYVAGRNVRPKGHGRCSKDPHGEARWASDRDIKLPRVLPLQTVRLGRGTEGDN